MGHAIAPENGEYFYTPSSITTNLLEYKTVMNYLVG